MARDHERESSTRSDRPGEEGDPAVVCASSSHGRDRFDPGASALDSPATTRGAWRAVLGCLAWYLVMFGVLILLEYLTAWRPQGDTRAPDRNAAAVEAAPEGPGRHQ